MCEGSKLWFGRSNAPWDKACSKEESLKHYGQIVDLGCGVMQCLAIRSWLGEEDKSVGDSWTEYQKKVAFLNDC